MPYTTMVDGVALFHILWYFNLAFAAFGSWLILPFNWFSEWVKDTILANAILSYLITVISNIVWLGCPLWLLEKDLRSLAHNQPLEHPDSFTAKVLESSLGVTVTPTVVTIGMIAVGVVTMVVSYHFFVSRLVEPKGRARSTPTA